MEPYQAGIGTISLTLGCLFVAGMVADILGRFTPLPRVTLLLITGFVVGPSLLDWLPDMTRQWFPLVTNVALSMIGFLIGGHLHRDRLGSMGKDVFGLSIGITLATIVLIPVMLIAMGVSPLVALLLGGIATATDPAATVDVVNEAGAKGTFAGTLLGIVAIDDVWGLIAFSLLLAVAQILSGHTDAWQSLQTGLIEIGGALILGILIGLLMALLSGRIQSGEPTQAEALGGVLIAAGLADYFDVSSILTTIVMGAVVCNVASHHERPFHAIRGIEWPFLILFFFLAGAGLQIASMLQVGLLTITYVMARIITRVLGAWLGGYASKSPLQIRRWMGLALLPQAGVALGMALIAIQHFPDLHDVILPVVLSSTIFFELIGPVLTRWSLRRSGEIQTNSKPELSD